MVSSVFRRWVMTCPGTDFCGCILFGVCSASWIYRFLSLVKLGKFSAILFFPVLSHPCPLSSVLPGLQWHECRCSVTVPQISKALFNCFLCHSGWMVSVVLSCSSLIVASVPSLCCWAHSLTLYFIYCIFSLKFQFYFNFFFPFLLRPIYWGSVFICFKCVHDGSLKYFCRDYFMADKLISICLFIHFWDLGYRYDVVFDWVKPRHLIMLWDSGSHLNFCCNWLFDTSPAGGVEAGHPLVTVGEVRFPTLRLRWE